MDISLVRANIIVNCKRKNINYNGVNCYAHGLNISLLPEALNISFYNPGVFSKSDGILTKENLLEKIENDFKVLGIDYKSTSPSFYLNKENTWKMLVFVKYNKNASISEKLKQIGGADDICDVHFVKIKGHDKTHKFGYKNEVKEFNIKEVKDKGYEYVKTYKLCIK